MIERPRNSSTPANAEECSLQSFLSATNPSDPGPWTSHLERLIRSGFYLPPAESLNDRQLSAKLKELVNKLAELRVFLVFTNHLSDRELYGQLVQEALRDRIRDVEPTGEMAYVLGLLGSSQNDLANYLKYYASDDEREEFAYGIPTQMLPSRRRPPFDRDRHLPRPDTPEGTWEMN